MTQVPRTCSEVEAALPLYVGADLDAAEMEAVGEHVEGCPPCRRLSERARTARRAFASLRDEGSAAPDLWARMREPLRAEGLLAPSSGPRPIPATPGRRLWMRRAAAAAVLIGGLSLALAGIFGPGNGPSSGDGPAEPQGLAGTPDAGAAGIATTARTASMGDPVALGRDLPPPAGEGLHRAAAHERPLTDRAREWRSGMDLPGPIPVRVLYPARAAGNR